MSPESQLPSSARTVCTSWSSFRHSIVVPAATSIEAARLLVYRAAQRREQEKPCAKEVAMAKMFASDTAMQAAIDAIQIFGSYGCMRDYPVERLFREAKVTQIYEGTNEVQRIVIGRELLRGR